MILLPDDERQRLLSEINADYKKILDLSAADLDAAGASAILPPSPEIKPGFWRRLMAKLVTVRELRRNAASQTAPATVSDATALALQSSTEARPFAKPDPVDVEYVPVELNSLAPIPATRRPWFYGLTVGAIGIGLATVGLVNNYHFNAAFGHSSFESLQLGAVGFLIDAAAIVLLPASTLLWRDRHQFYSLVAFGLWLAACLWSMNTTASFTAQLTGDQAASRRAQITSSQDAHEQRSAAIAIAAKSLELARTRADKQKANADLAKVNSAPIISNPLIATAEPEHMFATAAQNRFIRITGATIFPSLAGLFLSFGMLLLRRR